MSKTTKPKFEVLSEQLQTALMLVESFLHVERGAYSPIPPIYTSLLLETFFENGVARLTASNLEASISVYIKISKIESDFAICIPGINLAKLRRHFDGLVKFAFDPEEGKLQVRFGKSTTNFKIRDADEFRKPGTGDLDCPAMIFDRREMKQLLEEVLAPAKLVESMPNLQHVFFDPVHAENRIKIFSTDSVEISLNAFMPGSLDETCTRFSLHHKNIKKLISALGYIQLDTLELHFINKNNTMLFIAPGEANIYFQITPDAVMGMPEYNKILEKEHVTHIDIPLHSVRTFLKRALLLEADKLHIYHRDADEPRGFVRFVAETSEVGRTMDKYYAQILGERDFSFIISPKRLLGLLSQFKCDYNQALILELKEGEYQVVCIGLKGRPNSEMALMPMTT